MGPSKSNGIKQSDLTFFYMGMDIPIKKTPVLEKIDIRTLRNPHSSEIESDEE
jgi:hypothetical protein